MFTTCITVVNGKDTLAYRHGLNTLESWGMPFHEQSTPHPADITFTIPENLELPRPRIDDTRWIYVVRPAGDSRIVYVPSTRTWKTDKLWIDRMLPLWEVSTWEWLYARRVRLTSDVLYGACTHNSLALVRWLLGHGVKDTIEDGLCTHGRFHTWACLYRATLDGYADIVEALFAYLTYDTNLYHPLITACKRGYVRITRILLRYGACADTCAWGTLARPLEVATDARIAKTLLDHGANVHGVRIYDSPWRTEYPLLQRIREGNVECVRVLLEYGANASHIHALPLAVNRDYTSITKLLLRYGANVHMVDVRKVPEGDTRTQLYKAGAVESKLTRWVLCKWKQLINQ